MHLFLRRALLGALLVACSACSHDRGQPAAATQEAANLPAVPRARPDSFTGEVVRRNGEYRFKLLDEGEQVLRLTRSRDPHDFASDELQLRKYYGKTIVVQGTRHEGWIVKAQVVGQWLRPGESRGSTLTGPEPH